MVKSIMTLENKELNSYGQDAGLQFKDENLESNRLNCTKVLEENGIYHINHKIRTVGAEAGEIHTTAHIVLFTISGQGLVITPDFKRILKAGDLLIVPAKNISEIHLIDGADWDCISFHLCDVERWSRVRSLEVSVFPNHNAERLSSIIDCFINESASNAPNSIQISNLYVELILNYLERHLDITYTPHDLKMKERFNNLWDIVNSEVDKKWTINELSEMIAMSRSHFTRLCIKYCNYPPMQYIKHLRIKKAMSLLKREDLSIGQLSEKVGYTDQFAFSTAFKSITGISPTIYRNDKSKAN